MDSMRDENVIKIRVYYVMKNRNKRLLSLVISLEYSTPRTPAGLCLRAMRVFTFSLLLKLMLLAVRFKNLACLS